jgi:hypothetical protein
VAVMTEDEPESESTARQLADLADLKAAKRRRELLRRGTPEWEDAINVEEGLIDRIRRWAHRRKDSKP